MTNIKGILSWELNSIEDLDNKFEKLCEIILYNMAFNKYFSYEGQYRFIDLYHYIENISTNFGKLDTDFNIKSLKHYLIDIRKYKNIRYTYASLLGMLKHNDYVDMNNIDPQYFFINDLQNYQTTFMSSLVLETLKDINHSQLLMEPKLNLSIFDYKALSNKEKTNQYQKLRLILQCMILRSIQESLKQNRVLIEQRKKHIYILAYIKYKHQMFNRSNQIGSGISKYSSKINTNKTLNSKLQTKITPQQDPILAQQTRYINNKIYSVQQDKKGNLQVIESMPINTQTGVQQRSIYGSQNRQLMVPVYGLQSPVRSIQQIPKNEINGIAKRYTLKNEQQWNQFVIDTTQKMNNKKYQEIVWSYIQQNREKSLPKDQMCIFDNYSKKDPSQVNIMPSETLNKCIEILKQTETQFRNSINESDDQQYLFVENMPLRVPDIALLPNNNFSYNDGNIVQLESNYGLYSGYLLRDIQTNKLFKHGPGIIESNQGGFPILFELNEPNLL